MNFIVASIFLIGASAKPSIPPVNANAKSASKISIAGAGGLRGPEGAVVETSRKQRALFLDDLFSGGGYFEELFACGETCTDDNVCNSFMATFDPTSIFEEACNAGCFPEIQLSSCEQYCNDDGTSEGQTIVDVAVGNADFSTLVAAVTAAGLVDDISGEGPFTVFAPTNEAFAALPEGTVESLLLPENIEQLQDILKYHVVAGLYPSASLTSGTVETLNGGYVTIAAVSGAGVVVNDANVVTADIMASNGIIHVIDKVLLPPVDDGQVDGGAPATVARAAGRTRFFDATTVDNIVCSQCRFYQCCVGSDEAPNPTKYETCKGYLEEAQAASEQALEEIVDSISNVVSELILPGDDTGTSGASSGFDQLIDVFVDLFEDPSGGAALDDDVTADAEITQETTPTTDDSVEGTIALLATMFDDLSTLVATITAAGLVDYVSGEGPFTVFAPTNEAFAALPEGTVESLLLPENSEQLQDILKYHVVAGLYPSSDLLSGDIYTLNGDSVSITVSDAGVVVNDANVVTADIMASNGVIHVIDKVLLPPVDNVTEEQANATAEEPADVEATQTTEASVEAVLPESQGNNAGITAEAGLAELTESSSEIPAEDTIPETIAEVSVDTTISAASLENSASSASAVSVYAMASIVALYYFVSF